MADTRRRMVEATIQALQRHGVAGMSFTNVLHDSGAARGAIYHHFPGGKTQLVAEAAARNGADVRASLETLPAGDPLTVVQAFLDAVRPVLVASTAGGGCAIAALTVTAADEGRSDTDLHGVAASIFASWAQVLADRLQPAGHPDPAGLPHDDAVGLATTLIMLLEGAHVLCRATGTLEPFEQAARTALNLTRARYGGP